MQATASKLAVKLREKGIRGFGRAIINRTAYAGRRTSGFLSWVFPALGRLMFPRASSDRRILLIYDLSSQPFSIGDILAMQSASLVLREQHHADKVDFALVYNRKKPAFGHAAFAGINEDNLMFHLASVIPIAQVNQHLGSLFVFDSEQKLQRFISDNAASYYVWPSAWEFTGGDYLYFPFVNELLYDYYREHGTIPYLTCKEFLREWTEEFYAEHVYPNVPVTVNLRNNKSVTPRRNSRMEAWLEFFSYCEDRYPVKFIVICSRSEVDERLRSCPNVIVAKDHYTGIEHDLALIHTAAFHMGASSGPASMAGFGPKPYLLVNTDLVPEHYKGMIREGDFVRHFFAGPLQRLSFGVETAEQLAAGFAEMWSTVDASSYNSSAGRKGDQPKEAVAWLR